MKSKANRNTDARILNKVRSFLLNYSHHFNSIEFHYSTTYCISRVTLTRRPELSTNSGSFVRLTYRAPPIINVSQISARFIK